MDIRRHLSSLKRGLRVLAMFNVHGALRISDVARELSLPRTTAQRIIETLVAEGFVERAPSSRFYRLTPAVNMLSGGFSDESWVSHVASPMLFAETKEIGWPLMIATPVGEDMMVRVSTDHASPLALDHFPIGFKTPIMHATSGHVVLAFAPPAYRTALLKLLRGSDNPKQALSHDHEKVEYLIAKIRRLGFAHNIYAAYPEASIGVPIFLDGAFAACLLMGYMKRVITPGEIERRLLPVLTALARRIEDSVKLAKDRANARVLADTADLAAGAAAQIARPRTSRGAAKDIAAGASRPRFGRIAPDTR